MKKIILTVLMLSILLPSALFAASPSDEEVYQATVAVLSVFGLVFMSSMFGETPANVTMDMNMETGYAKMEFEKFPVQDFSDSMSEMMETSVDDEIIFEFKEMSGKIEVDNAGNLDMDVSLLGGNVKTLVLKSEGEDIVSIEANGESFNHLKDQLMEKSSD